MTRINIYTIDEVTDERVLEGWFDPHSATRYDEGTRWDGDNHIGVITGSPWIREFLFRTSGGRWVHNYDATRYRNGDDTYVFVTDEWAKDWLLRSQINDEAVEKYFGEIEAERGPGRPEIGPAVNMRFHQEQLDAIDARAKTEGVSRAAMIRSLVAASL